MFFFLFFFLLLSCSFSLEVTAKRMERLPDGSILAEGEVRVNYKNFYLEAEILNYDPTSGTIYAMGHIYIRSDDGRFEVSGTEALVNLQRDTGYFLNAEGRFEKFYFSAEKVEKEEEVYVVERGSITTCPPNRKEMALCFSRARISERYVFSQDNTLRFFDVPIAYLPVSFFPIGERRSGLLPPTIGSNTFNYFIYQQPIYWAIAPDRDLTLTLDFRDRQAKGINLEYRQSIKRELDLTGTLSFYREPFPAGKWWAGRSTATFRENRYRLKWNLELEGLKAGLDLVSDPFFMQDIYLGTRERTVPYLSSYLSYVGDWENFLLTIDIRRFYDTTSENNKRTLQRLPEVGLYLKEQRLTEYLYLNFFASYTNFYREEGLRAQRLLFFPEVSLVKPILGLNFLSTLTLENLAYVGIEDGHFRDRQILASVRFREELPYFFDFSFGEFNFKNFSTLTYSIRPDGYENPRFDQYDQLNRESLIQVEYRSFGYYSNSKVYGLFLSGGYNFTGEFTYQEQIAREKTLPVRARLELYPAQWLTLSSDNIYDTSNGRFLKSVDSLGLRFGSAGLNIGRVLERNYSGTRLNDQYSLSTSLTYRPLNLAYSMIRDNKVKKEVRKEINLEYRGACWSSGVLLRDTYDGKMGSYLKEVYLTLNVFDLQRFTSPLRR